MKNKTFNVIVLILLIVSVAGNILLYSRLKTSTTDNQNLNTTVSEIQASMDNLENQLSDLQQQLSDSTTKNEELQENNDSLQSELEQLQSEMEKLQSEKNEASLLSDTKPTSNTNTSNSTSTTNNNSNSNSNSSTTTPSQGSSLTQENVGAILDNLFGEGTAATGGGNGGTGSMNRVDY